MYHLLPQDWYWRSQGDFSTSQNLISAFHENKFKSFGFHAVVLMKTFPLMYQ